MGLINSVWGHCIYPLSDPIKFELCLMKCDINESKNEGMPGSVLNLYSQPYRNVFFLFLFYMFTLLTFVDAKE